MDNNPSNSDAAEPQDGSRSDFEATATHSDHESATWLAQFAQSGPPVDPDRVWLQIAKQLDEVEPPGRSLVIRAYTGARRAFQRVARFATITGGGWGGPLVVGLFAILVIATLIAAHASQGPRLS